jgi:hypothetical protein
VEVLEAALQIGYEDYTKLKILNSLSAFYLSCKDRSLDESQREELIEKANGFLN